MFFSIYLCWLQSLTLFLSVNIYMNIPLLLLRPLSINISLHRTYTASPYLLSFLSFLFITCLLICLSLSLFFSLLFLPSCQLFIFPHFFLFSSFFSLSSLFLTFISYFLSSLFLVVLPLLLSTCNFVSFFFSLIHPFYFTDAALRQL